MANYTEYDSYKELDRIKSLSAFNIKGVQSVKRVNQYMRKYILNDGSRLEIRPYSKIGYAYTNNGICVSMESLQINT